MNSKIKQTPDGIGV